MDDLQLLAGNFIHKEIPPQKEYLCHYFKTEESLVFLSYYLTFPDYYINAERIEDFYILLCDHTGYSFSFKTAKRYVKKVELIYETLEKAEKEFDLNTVGRIKSGKSRELIRKIDWLV